MNLHFVKELPSLPWVSFFKRKENALLFFEIPFLLFFPPRPKFGYLYTKKLARICIAPVKITAGRVLCTVCHKPYSTAIIHLQMR